MAPLSKQMTFTDLQGSGFTRLRLQKWRASTESDKGLTRIEISDKHIRCLSIADLGSYEVSGFDKRLGFKKLLKERHWPKIRSKRV
jgi:hypothetical protein